MKSRVVADLDILCFRMGTVTSAQLNCVTSWQTLERSWPMKRLMRWSEKQTLTETDRLTTKVSSLWSWFITPCPQWKQECAITAYQNVVCLIGIFFEPIRFLFGRSTTQPAKCHLLPLCQDATLLHVWNLVIFRKRTNTFSVSTEFVQMMTAKWRPCTDPLSSINNLPFFGLIYL